MPSRQTLLAIDAPRAFALLDHRLWQQHVGSREPFHVPQLVRAHGCAAEPKLGYASRRGLGVSESPTSPVCGHYQIETGSYVVPTKRGLVYVDVGSNPHTQTPTLVPDLVTSEFNEPPLKCLIVRGICSGAGDEATPCQFHVFLPFTLGLNNPQPAGCCISPCHLLAVRNGQTRK